MTREEWISRRSFELHRSRKPYHTQYFYSEILIFPSLCHCIEDAEKDYEKYSIARYLCDWHKNMDFNSLFESRYT